MRRSCDSAVVYYELGLLNRGARLPRAERHTVARQRVARQLRVGVEAHDARQLEADLLQTCSL